MKSMKNAKWLLFILVLIFAGCGWDDDVGGALPMIVVNWEGVREGGVLFPFYHDVGGEYRAVAARIGDDRAVLASEALRMLSVAGIEVSRNFAEEDMLTLGDARNIFTRIYPNGEGLLVTDENRDLPISYALWVDLLLRVVEIGEDGILAVNMVPLGQVEGKVFTNIGEFTRAELCFVAYMDMELRVLHRGGEIVAILGLVNRSPVLRNAYVVGSNLLGITISMGGATRHYVFAEGVEPLPDDTIIASLQISNGRILWAEGTDTVIRGTIERLGQSMDLREWGTLPLCHSFTVYDETESDITMRDINALLVGANMADFHIRNGQVVAAVITRDVLPTYIRVVIGTTGFTGLVHNHVEITSTGTFTVRGGGGRVERFAAGEVFRIAHDNPNANFWGGLRFYISPNNPSERLEIIGLGRNWPDGENPRYRGVFEISREGEGFIIINELPLEEYLYAVVPSEMPSFHGVEAAKVQAVTARTFAFHQFYANRFRALGAHVDDSVISQVYNNIPENEISIEAVRATSGQVLTFDGEVILANYFSTSGGTTANFGEVWAVNGSFPSYTPPYLRSMAQFDTRNFNSGDLRTEEAAAAFFRNTEIPAFDRNFPWFRWHVTMTKDELSERINRNLATRQAANPALIHSLDDNGYPPATNIGTLQHLEVTQRGQGGNVMEMIFHGTEASVRVQTEFNIRTLLNPSYIPVLRHDGTESGQLSLLPSAFFTIEITPEGVTFFGGGNGHGVGMSQNGVRALLDDGLSYREILLHYYQGARISQR